jgi:hypothetical protein
MSRASSIFDIAADAIETSRFFSQAARSAENLQRKTGNADGFKNDLIGKGQVKPDELKAMGFDEHFGDRKDITKEEVQQFINENQVQIKETLLSNAEGYRRGTKFGDYTLEGGDNYRELLLQDNSSAGLFDELNSLNGQIGDAKVALRNDQSALLNVAEDMQREADKFIGGDNTKENYDNYQRVNRELRDFQDGKPLSDEAAGKYIYGAKELIERRDELARQKANLPEPFINSSHFDEPNILAHLRMKDRVDADGNKTLLIEEAQSDWHQTGGDRGYVNKAEYEDLRSEQTRLNLILDETSIDAGFNWGQLNAPDLSSAVESARIAFRAARQKAEDFPLLDHSEAIGTTRDSLRAAKIELDDAFQQDYLKQNGVRPGAAHEQAQSEMQMLRAELDPMHDGVPDAPFKTDDKSSWYNLAMKRGLLEAAEGDYNKLAITTGRQQADRYDLSKQINEVRLGGNERDGFTVSAFDKNNTPVIMESIESLDELPNLIGKDAAKSLVDQPLTDTASGSARVLAGQDLSVGGEGMKQFYDRTLPNALGKLVKQDGVKVGQSELLGKTPSKTEIASASDREELLRLRDEIYNGDDTSATHDRYNELLAMYQPKPRTDTVHSIDITPEMRDRVKKGLPLFAQGGLAVGAGALFSPGEAQASSAKPQQDGILKDTADVALETMSGINRAVVDGINFLTSDQINAVLNLSGSDRRIPNLYDLPYLGSATGGNYMDKGLPRDIVRTGSEFLSPL